MVSAEKHPRFKLVGGRLCLDFVNTLDGARDGPSKELLQNYNALVAFGEQARLLGRRDAAALREEADGHRRRAGQVLGRAIALREALYRVLTDPHPSDVELLNKEIAGAMSHARLCASGECYEWGWERDATALDRVLWPIAYDAAELLTSPDLLRVHECDSGACSWLFLDETKNHKRRWCQMEVCGNRAKARRHRERCKKG